MMVTLQQGKCSLERCTMAAVENYWNVLYATTKISNSNTINRDPEGCLLEPLMKASQRALTARSQH